MLKGTLLTLCLLLLAVCASANSFKVSDVLVEGNNRIDLATILAAIPIKPGDQVTLEDVDQAMRSIFSLGRFADISAEMTDIQGGKVVTFVVSELPLVRTILFAGNDALGEEKLRTLVTVKAPELFNHAKLKASVRDIEKAYAEEGYHAATVEPKVETDDRNEATLTFNINEGEKILIDAIRFIGQRVFTEDELETAMETKERWWLSWLTGRGAYQEELVQVDLERLKALYYDKGYLDVKVAGPTVTLTEKNKYLDLLIEINEGPQYKTGAIDVKGDLLKPKSELLKLVRLQTGEVFSRGELRKSILALTDLYADQGYAYVNVVPLTSKDQKQLSVGLMLEIEQGAKVFIEKVQVRGNTKTRDKVIRRQIPLAEGEQYSASKIKEANRNIRNLGFFEEVNVTTSPGSELSQTTLNVDVKEQATGSFSLGFGYSSLDRFVTQGSVTQDNFLGYGVKFNLSASLSATRATFSLGVNEPYFLDTDWTLGGQLYSTEYAYDEYDEKRTGGSIRAGHPISENTRLYLSYRYEQTEILDIEPTVTSLFILDQDKESTRSSLTVELVHNDTDYHPDPSEGGVSEFSFEYAGLGGSENFVKTIAEHRQFFPFLWDTVFSINGEIGYIVQTGDQDIPIWERFYLGGINSIRGFRSRRVGPRDGNDYIGGEKMAFLNFEYIFPIAKKLGLKGVVFYDTGNAWLESETFFSDMRNSVGAGIRWQSPLGPLRLEWGYNLAPRNDEEQAEFEFSMGRAF